MKVAVHCHPPQTDVVHSPHDAEANCRRASTAMPAVAPYAMRPIAGWKTARGHYLNSSRMPKAPGSQLVRARPWYLPDARNHRGKDFHYGGNIPGGRPSRLPGLFTGQGRVVQDLDAGEAKRPSDQEYSKLRKIVGHDPPCPRMAAKPEDH